MAAEEATHQDSAWKRGKEQVRLELEEIRDFVAGLKMSDIKDGSWFAKILAYSMHTYTEKVDAEYFRTKYPDLPADAIVQARIQMAARYSAVEGGLSSAAYTSVLAATISSGGGASPVTLPAASASFVLDLVYVSQLQLKLAYDISVLYSIPLDLGDPEDLWKFIRVAFAVEASETTRAAALKGVPVAIRPVVKKIFSNGTLTAVKSLPVVGKYLLQRNIVKFSLPAIGVPVTIGVNYWTTKSTGRLARAVLRSEATSAETAERIVEKNTDLIELLWAVWAVADADHKTTEGERFLLRDLALAARDAGVDEEQLEILKKTINLDESKVWSMLEKLDDLTSIYEAAIAMAVADGKISKQEIKVLHAIADIGGLDFDEKSLRDSVKK
jgi:tellurite resistance protein